MEFDPESRRVKLNGKEIYPDESQMAINHSPDGFNWGYEGSGPAQTALAILLEVTGNEKLSAELHQEFKRQYLARKYTAPVIVDIYRWVEDRINSKEE